MRQIVEETSFELRKRALFKSDQQADVVLDAVTFLLAAEPDLSQYQLIGPTPLGDLRVIRTSGIATAFKSLVVYFTVDSMDKVHLIDVRHATKVP